MALPREEVPEASRRWWIIAAVAVLLVAVNAVAAWLARSGVLDGEPLAVAAFEPQGEAPPRCEVTVAFNRDAIRRDEFPAPVADDAIRFSPETPGHAFWRSPRELVFRPQTAFPRATPIRAFLNPRIGEDVGLRLEGRLEFAFETERLKVVRARQIAFTPQLDATIRLEFNDPVEPRALARALQVANESGDLLSFRVRSHSPTPEPLIEVRGVEGTVVLKLAKGLRGVSGPLGLREDVTLEVPISRDLRFTGIRSEPVFQGHPNLVLLFNRPLAPAAPEELRGFIVLEPDPGAKPRVAGDGTSIVLEGPFEPGAEYRVTVRRGLGGRDGVVLLADTARDVRVPDRPSRAEFVSRSGVLRRGGDCRVRIRAANLESVAVTAHKVLPVNLVHYAARRSSAPFLRKGRKIRLALDAPKNACVERAVDLADLIEGDEAGIWVLELRYPPDSSWAADRITVTVSDIGLSVREGANGLLVWTTSLESGRPLAHARVRLRARNNNVLAEERTDREGVAFFPGPFEYPDGPPYLVTAEAKGDLSYLRLGGHGLPRNDFDVRGRDYLERGYEAFVYSDRGAYRPGETVHIAAIVRDRHMTPPEPFPVELLVRRPDGRTLAELSGKLRPGGGADFEIPLSPHARTGRYTAELRLPGGGPLLGTRKFLVEDYLPQRLRARIARVGGASEERLRPGETLALLVSGGYFAGFPAQGAKARVRWRLRPGGPVPGEAAGFHFGDPSVRQGTLRGTLAEVALDARGEARFEFEVPGGAPGRPLVLEIEAEVRDAGGRPVYAFLELPVDPTPHYVGVRIPGGAAPAPGVPVPVEIVAVDPRGAPSTLEAVELKTARVEWSSILQRSAPGRYRYASKEREEPLETRAVTLKDGRAEAMVIFPAPGRYRVRAVDPATGAGGALTIYVSGEGARWTWNLEEPERLEIRIPRQSLRPGDRVPVTIRAPFDGAALLTVESDRVLARRVGALSGGEWQVEVTVPEHAAGNLYVSACAVRPLSRPAPGLPARAWGIVPLRLDRTPEALELTLDAPPEVRPGERIRARVRIRDFKGRPAAGEVTLFAVDEGVLALTNEAPPDPWSFFYGKRAHAVKAEDLYGSLLEDVPLEIVRARPGGGVASSDDGAGFHSPVAARRSRTAALWLGTYACDPSGDLVVPLQVPDFRGELRLSAVAHSGRYFGSAARAIRVRTPLHLEVGLPRFAAPGDLFQATVQVFNGTRFKGKLALELELEGHLVEARGGGAGLAFASFRDGEELDAGASQLFEFPLRAGPGAGRARVTVRARLEPYASGPTQESAVTVELPVRPAAPRTSRNRSGTVTSRTPLRLEVGDDWFEGTARHRLVIASRPEVRFGGALEALIGFPYGCLEQTTSKAFPLLYLEDLAALLVEKREGPGASGEPPQSQARENAAAVLRRRETFRSWVERAIERIFSMQGPGGWLAAWPAGAEPWPWATAYAAHFLIEARARGFRVPEEDFADVLDWLERNVAGQARGRSLLERAYAVFVLALAGREGVEGRVEALVDRSRAGAADPSGEARVLLAAALVRLGKPEEALELLGDPLPPGGDRELGGTLRSQARRSALLLSVLLDLEPESPRTAALLERLAGLAQDGHWGTTQDNAFALLALGKYAALSRGTPKSGRLRLSVGRREPVVVEAGKSYLLEGDLSGELIAAEVEGEGVFYWFLHESGVPAAFHELGGGQRRGIELERRFLSSDFEPLPALVLRRGEVVVVEVRAAAGRPLENVVISDLLPAGLEIENPRLGAASKLLGARALHAEHLDLRDDRVLIFTRLGGDGVAVYRYLARAVTAGEFTLPPLGAECLYEPGIHAQTEGGRLRIE